MRVVLYTHSSLFEPALGLAEALSARAEVHLLVEVPAGGGPTASFEGRTDGLAPGLVDADPILAPVYPAAVRDRWHRTASFQLVVPGRYRARDPRSLLVLASILRRIRALRPDVVHIDDVDVSARLALLLATRRRSYPLLMGCHDPDPHSGERRWRLKQSIRRLVLPAVDAVLVHHAAGREAFQRRHPGFRRPVHVVRLGAYAWLSDLASSEHVARSGRTALFFGRLTPYKGLDLLYAAAPAVARAVPGVRFVVAGRPVAGYQPPAVPVLAGGGEFAVEEGYIDAPRMSELFGGADLVLCPYTDASQSGVVLTAFAFGCPVVATDVGGLGEYVEHGRTGIIVPPGDAGALAEVLIRLLSEPAELGGLRAGVDAEVAGPLSWSSISEEIVAVYSAVVAGAGRRR